jgi:hypothetical protein
MTPLITSSSSSSSSFSSNNNCSTKFSWLSSIRFSILFLSTSFVFSSAVVFADADTVALVDSIDRIEAYTVEVDPILGTSDDYYYLGFVHGLPHQAVNLGFTGKQSTSRHHGFFIGQPFTTAKVRRDPYGLRYYSLAWSANSMGSTIMSNEQRRDQGASLNEGQTELLTLPPAFDSAGNPKSGRRARLNLFDERTVEFLKKYVRTHVNVWSETDPVTATGKVIEFWGLDNEWEGEGGPDYSPEARSAFSDWLDHEYGADILGLNEAWEADFVSFTDAAQSNLPGYDDYKSRPGAFLDWWRFQTLNFVTTLADLANTMHETDPLHRAVLHKATQQTIEMPGVNRSHIFDQDAFAARMRPISGGLLGADMYGSGDRQAYELGFLYNCIRPESGEPGYGVLLAESNNHSGPGHSFAATTWRMLANGLKGVDFFTLGFAGAKTDWDKFGFIDSATGLPKSKLFYAGRWSTMLHRTEAFWRASIPAPSMPRIAMLMPRRDVLLSDISDRSESQWGYAENHRWMVYRWLCENGYWVDVIPYSKLSQQWLKQYEGIFLVGANHLTPEEANNIESFVEEGGILVADDLAGLYDEHHRERHLLKSLLGGLLDAETPRIQFQFNYGSEILSVKGWKDQQVSPNAQVLLRDSDGSPLAVVSSFGAGKSLYFPFMLGTLKYDGFVGASGSFVPLGPTADAEEYRVVPGDLAIGRWMNEILQQVGLKASYTADSLLMEEGNLRVSQPYEDEHGNCAVIITTRADSELRTLPQGSVEMPLPGSDWDTALWASAEDEGLTPLSINKLPDGRYRFTLPPVATAGVLYFFRDHVPLLGVLPVAGSDVSIDGHTAKVKPGVTFPVTVQLFNVEQNPVQEGQLRAIIPQGWQVSPAHLTTDALAVSEGAEYTFTVTADIDPRHLKSEWIYPIVFRWSEDGEDKAVIKTQVQVDLAMNQTMKLLSGNQSYPGAYPYRSDIGATYRYENSDGVKDPAGRKNENMGPALTNGYGDFTGGHYSVFWQKEYVASFNQNEVAIFFDLPKTQEVNQVMVAFGTTEPAPISIKVLTQSAGAGWNVRDSQAFDSWIGEYTSPIFKANTRCVRIEITWPQSGGTVDEVEIWGRDLN